MEHSEILTIFATSKGSLWLSGQNPARGKPLSTLPNFSMPKVLFDYPGRIPRGQDHIDTTQKRVSIFMMLTYFFVIIRCLKNKTQIFLAVCKIQCTFAAKLVFHNLYNHSERNQQRCSFLFFDVLNYHQIGW